MKTSKSSLLIWNVVTVSESLQSASWVRHQCCVNTLIEFFAIEHIGRLSELYSASMALCNFTKLCCYFTWKHNSFRPPMTQAFQGGDINGRESNETENLWFYERSQSVPASWRFLGKIMIVFWLYSSCFTNVFLYKYILLLRLDSLELCHKLLLLFGRLTDRTPHGLMDFVFH